MRSGTVPGGARGDVSAARKRHRTGESTGVPLHRRRLTPDDRRAELVDAAIELLRGGGDEGNWVADVTRAAGAAKGTFYVYFPSWEAMLAVVRRRLVDEASAPIRDALAGSAHVDWWEVLEAECERFVDVVTEFGRHHALIFHTPLPPDPAGTPRTAPALVAAALERGIAEGSFGSVDLEAAAAFLVAVIHAAADAVLAGGDRTRWIAACMALAHAYLVPPTPAAGLADQPTEWTSPA